MSRYYSDSRSSKFQPNAILPRDYFDHDFFSFHLPNWWSGLCKASLIHVRDIKTFVPATKFYCLVCDRVVGIVAFPLCSREILTLAFRLWILRGLRMINYFSNSRTVADLQQPSYANIKIRTSRSELNR